MKKDKIIIKFNQNVIAYRKNNNLLLKPLALQNNLFNQLGYIAVVPDEILQTQGQISNINFSSLSGMFYIKGSESLTVNEKQQLLTQLNGYDFIEYAELECTRLASSILSRSEQLNDIETPDFTKKQEYKLGAGQFWTGIDMEYAWSLGVTGKGIRIADIEAAFNYQHINLQRDSFIPLVVSDDVNELEINHGTAVAGVMYAKELGFGVKGMVHGADALYGISVKPYDAAGGIVRGLQHLRAGDIFIYELSIQSRADDDTTQVPADFCQSVWDITKAATDAGIIIIAAAGNGGENLDDDFYAPYRARGDNGAIRVGAGSKNQICRAFSTYGKTMIHVQAWGDSVVTTGFGTLYDGGPNNNYANNFDGTSAATPIVASAAIAIQSWYKQQTGRVLTPKEMRSLLIETGTPQRPGFINNHIGPLPNVRNAINVLQQGLPQ
ncbi:MAG TPA: S8 family serine peptidase [Arsenophonus apicola]